MRSRVVITGLGPVCATGVGIDDFWDALLDGRSSLTPIESIDASGFRPKLGGEVDGIKVRDFVPKSYRKATKIMARDTQLAVISAKLAADDAGLTTRGSESTSEPETTPAANLAPPFTISPARTGCQIGAGLIAADTQELALAVVSAEDEDGQFSMEKWGTEEVGDSGMNNLPPLWLLKYLPNMLACHVTIIHGLEGPSNTIMGAEASAILSIGESTRVIERGSADICFSGGAESRINPLGLLRWDYTGRLADTGEHTDGSTVSMPYNPESLGGIIGEAGGMIIIENEQHASKRGASPYAVIKGFGAAQSPSPMYPGSSKGPGDPAGGIDLGLESAIESALADAGLSADDIDLIFPLGLGVPELDRQEQATLESIFGDQMSGAGIGKIPYFTCTNCVGNTMAAHGGLMVAAAAKCLKEQRLPLNTRFFGTGESASQSPNQLNHILVCTGSLGGQTAALVLKKYEPNSE